MTDIPIEEKIQRQLGLAGDEYVVVTKEDLHFCRLLVEARHEIIQLRKQAERAMTRARSAERKLPKATTKNNNNKEPNE